MNLIIATILLCAITYVNGDCGGRTSVIRNGTEYRLFFNRANKQSAKRACKTWGELWKSAKVSDLINHIDRDLQTCLREMIGRVDRAREKGWILDNPRDGAYFIGGSLRNSTTFRQGWYWDEGKRIPLPGEDSNDSVFQKWAEQEPMHRKPTGEKRCLSAAMITANTDGVYEPGDWVDQSCDNELFYICQREVADELVWGFSENDHAIPPQEWGTIKDFYKCNSKVRQSPQDVNVSRSINRCNDGDVTTVLRWEQRKGVDVQWIVKNTGRMIEIRTDPPRSLFTVFNETSTPQVVDFMHLKWGAGPSNGSEHAIGGVKYAGELQVFHEHNEQGERHALAFMIQQRVFLNNERWQPLLDTIFQTSEATSQTIMQPPPKNIMTLLGDSLRSREYATPEYNMGVGIRYKGSLTQPPCTEDVIWTVYVRPVQLSFGQFNRLRQLLMEGRESSEYRLLTQTTRSIQQLKQGHCQVRR